MSGIQFQELLQTIQNLYAHAVFPVFLTDGALHVVWANDSAKNTAEAFEKNRKKGTIIFSEFDTLSQDMQAGRTSTFHIKTAEQTLFTAAPVMNGTKLLGCQMVGKIESAVPAVPESKFIYDFDKKYKIPLTVIFSTLGLLSRDKEQSPTSIRYLRLIMQNAYRLLRFSQNMSRLFAIQSGEKKPHFKNGDICRFLQEISSAANVLTEQIGIPLSYHSEQESEVMSFDPELLEFAILNLISNACRYTREKNQIQILLEFTMTETIIRVTDHGMGMEASALQKLQAYLKNPTTVFSEEMGTGFQLVHWIVEKHGGTISVKSQLDEGTSVTLSLPRQMKQALPFYFAQSGAHYLKNRFSTLYVELSDVCGAPIP